MSAPNQGRQSPEPERQTGGQLHDPPSNPTSQDAAGHTKDASDQQKEGLSSNPTGPLEQAAKDKTSKGT
ncbi:MAG: hypothetical protein M1821_001435 [Bathelium mastoideum]|nr:MAG: hypothetical protein M1821_001435 [Bathelium mastoideum]KAI9689964.1 MAG: hypothetical protein M1822_009846 [Bathelium mastoideum]